MLVFIKTYITDIFRLNERPMPTLYKVFIPGFKTERHGDSGFLLRMPKDQGFFLRMPKGQGFLLGMPKG